MKTIGYSLILLWRKENKPKSVEWILFRFSIMLMTSRYWICKHITAFTNAEETAAELSQRMPFLLQDRVTALGAEFVAAPLWNNRVIVDGKFVTGQNPQSNQTSAQAVSDLLTVTK